MRPSERSCLYVLWCGRVGVAPGDSATQECTGSVRPHTLFLVDTESAAYGRMYYRVTYHCYILYIM